MSEADVTSKLESLLRATAHTLLETERELESARAVEHEPIAIVSMACRLPGGIDEPEAFWELLQRGGDAIGPFPQEWDTASIYDADPDAPGKCYVREGGFVSDRDRFDASFFGIAPREAQAMDPQQRIVLEVAWEALERAGITEEHARESATGVYLGCMSSDYGADQSALDTCDGYAGTGRAGSVVSGRLSYFLGLQGPSITIDTACSSSLVAVHLACSALRKGECAMALAGGVTMMSTPRTFVEFSRLRALSPSARCRSFSSVADGAVWSEGCGLILLKRLSDAQRDGDEILALIRGTAVNQDGRSQGLSAPNGPSQQRVIRAALTDALLNPEDVDAIEAHGTGTTLGDPIEAGALAEVFGQGEREVPVYLGSSKSNIGHAQAAAGIAGLIKVVLSLRHQELPRTLHAEELSPHIDWPASRLHVLQAARAWRRTERVRRAGISAFGISGTNAHVIVEEAPAGPAEAADNGASAAEHAAGSFPLVFSARDPAALRDQAARWAEWLENAAQPWANVVASAALARTHFAERALVAAKDAREARDALRAFSQGQAHPLVTTDTAQARGKVVFVFPGQGSQWLGMGQALLEESDVFRAAVTDCDRALAPHLGWSVIALLRGVSHPSLPPFERVDAVQPALFAVSLGLAAEWRALGLEPDAVIGHSQGEVSAAVVAGALSLEDGARVVALRSRAVHTCSGRGAMVVVERPLAEVEALIQEWSGALSIAAVNTPRSTIVSGEVTAADQLVERLTQSNVFCRKVNVDYASHSAQMEPLLPELRLGLSSIRARPPTLPFYSTVTGERLRQEQALDAEYWCRNLRQTVRFDRALDALLAHNHGVFVEISPHPVLAMPLGGACGEHGGVVVGSLQRDRGGRAQLARSLAELHVRGVRIPWAQLMSAHLGRAALPTYAFQRTRHWLEAPRLQDRDLTASGMRHASHALIGALTSLADGSGLLLCGKLSEAKQPWIADHVALGVQLAPGTALVELALYAAQTDGTAGSLAELTLLEPLPSAQPQDLQIAVTSPDANGYRSFAIHSRREDPALDGPWCTNATGVLAPESAVSEDLRGALDELRTWPVPGAEPVALDGLYGRLEAAGLNYGATFRGLQEMSQRGDTIYARVVLPEQAKGSAADYLLHPALLDAALHAVALTLLPKQPAEKAERSIYVPFAWSDVRLYATGATELRVGIRIAPSSQDGDLHTVSLTLADGAGEALASIAALQLRKADEKQLRHATTGEAQHLYRLELQAIQSTELEPATRPRPAILGTSSGLAHILGVAPRSSLAALLADGDAGRKVPSQILVDLTQPLDLGASSRELAEAVERESSQALALLQDWLKESSLAETELVWVTRGAIGHEPGAGAVDLARAAVWGLVRSARNEHPERTLRLLDLGPDDPDRSTLLRAIQSKEESEQVLQRGVLHAIRLKSVRASEPGVMKLPDEPWRLELAERGRLDALTVRSLRTTDASTPLAPGHVRIQVRAAGLNFRDVLNALGIVTTPQLGLECAGIVSEVGPGVDGLTVGDRVMGMCLGSFASEVDADARHVIAFPDAWTFAEAATLPVTYLTALYALEDLGNIRRGERILVHAAAGGVGLAAVQLAKHFGAEVFATASQAKWPLLRRFGIDDAHLASSRDTEFARRWLAGGRGPLDLVLNSLSGEFVDASLRLLRSGGRFLEMGKTDLRAPAEVESTYSGVSYRPLDLREVRPERIAELLRKIIRLVQEGAIKPLPLLAYDVRYAESALRHMAQARHVGKLVLSMPRAVEGDRTVLLTGGTGELARSVAEHLVRAHAVRHLVLASRRGADIPDAALLAERLRALGAETVQLVACDISDRSEVERLLSHVDPARPLTGVVHLAGALDDGLIASQTPERMRRALAAKVGGALHLHELTKSIDLAFFVLFSSAAGTLGGPGQANYAAANASLDAIAAWRCQQGLPAMSLAWGLWEQAGTGMTSHLGPAELARLRRQGIAPLRVEHGLRLLDAALTRPEATLAPVRLDLARLQASARDGAPSHPLLAGLVRPSLKRANASRIEATDLRKQLAALPVADRIAALAKLIRGEVAAVLGLPGADAVDQNRELHKLGLDSLMAVELRNRLGVLVGSTLLPTVAFDHPTPLALANFLLREKLAGLAGEPESKPAADVSAEELDAFSEALLHATPEQLHTFGLLAGLRDLRNAVASSLPTSSGNGEGAPDVWHGETDDLVKFLECRLEADA